MLKSAITFLLLFIFLSAGAQSPNMEWGEIQYQNSKDKTRSTEAWAVDEEGYYVQQCTGFRCNLLKFNHQHEEIYREELFDEGKEKHYRFEKIVRTPSGIYGICNYRRAILILSHRYRFAKITDKGVEFLTELKQGHYEPKLNGQLKTSRDGSKIAYFEEIEVTEHSGLKKVFYVHVFDSNGKLLWDKRTKLSAKDNRILLDDLYVMNDGTLRITTRRLEKAMRRHEIPYQYSILKITQEDTEFFDVDLDEGLLIASAKIIFEDSTGLPFISGTFTHTEYREFLQGVFSGKLNLREGKIDELST